MSNPEAQKQAAELAARMGEGWKPCSWWPAAAEHGPLMVETAGDGYWTAHLEDESAESSDPIKACRDVIDFLIDQRDRCQRIIDEARKALA